MIAFFTMKDILFYISWGGNSPKIYKIIDGVEELVIDGDSVLETGWFMRLSTESNGPWIGGNVLYMDGYIFNPELEQDFVGLIKFTV